MTTAEYPGPSSTGPPGSPPSKASLTNWWERFKKKTGKDDDKESSTGIFGVPLHKSIEYANVTISLTDENGGQFVYGYVPIVVAKCGVFLKENATEVEGIFRLSGSAKRIQALQTIFDSPEKYGKGLDWTGYTVHDAANVLRRYINCLPEPIIPLEFYSRFREPLSRPAESVSVDEAVKIYQTLISELPPLNRQLLLYILDLLAVFASKSEQNRMNADNLAAIFQPGLISHPNDRLTPQAYKISQDVLIFLINHQDHFLLGMRGSNDGSGQTNEAPPTPVTPTSLMYSRPVVAQPSPDASAGAEDVRKFGGVRRNASVSSRHSGGHGSGVNRSNTLPSKRSPRPRTSPSFRPTDGSSSPNIGQTLSPVNSQGPPSPEPGAPHLQGLGLNPTRKEDAKAPSPLVTPTKERNFGYLFSSDPEKPKRRLKKKRMSGVEDRSADSSTTSLPAGSQAPETTQAPPMSRPLSPPASPPGPQASQPLAVPGSSNSGTSGATSTSTLMPTMSPTPSATSSVTSQDSAHSYSDTNTSTSPEKKKRAKSRWRWSNSKVEGWNPGSPTYGSSAGSIAERMRRGSPSTPEGDRKVSSEGSGDDDNNHRPSKGALGWFKKLGERKNYPADNDIPTHIQVQQLPPPVYQSLPATPQVQPPTPAKEIERTLSANSSGTQNSDTTPTEPYSPALAQTNTGMKKPNLSPTPLESPANSTDSDVTLKGAKAADKEAPQREETKMVNGIEAEERRERERERS